MVGYQLDDDSKSVPWKNERFTIAVHFKTRVLGFGPSHQYLDPAWYHLCRLVSEKSIEDNSATLLVLDGFLLGKSPNSFTFLLVGKSDPENTHLQLGNVAAPLKLGRRLQEGHHVGVEPGWFQVPASKTWQFLAEQKKFATWRLIFFFRIGCFQKIEGNTPKWMVKIMENPIKRYPYFWKHPIVFFKREGFYRRGSWLLTLSVF